MFPELSNKYSWWQVGSVPVLLTEYRKSKVFQSLMYMQHRHTVCWELHIFHYLDLYQNVNDNSYPTPLLHEALDVSHKMVMLVISWYHNTFLHLCVQNQHYPEHDTLCLSIFFYWIFFYIFTWSMIPCLRSSLYICFCNSLARLTLFFGVQEWIGICESNIFILKVEQ